MVAQLIQMRQRIKAIETIKKITHAMRLIAMSTHARLKSKELALQQYNQELSLLFARLHTSAPEWKNPIISPDQHHEKKLIILIGSSKGLCGAFNTALFHFFEAYQKTNPITASTHIITIGKRARTYIQDHAIGTLVKSYDELNAATLNKIIGELSNYLLQQDQPYTKVHSISTFVKTFFTQKPRLTQLIPFEAIASSESSEKEEYIWPQSPESILNVLAEQYLMTQLRFIVFESLLAEHAARFISMDNSTRNAQNLLETTKIGYNKVRQAKITKEIAELAGSF